MRAGKTGETIMWIVAALAVLIIIIGVLHRPHGAPIYAKMLKQKNQFRIIEFAMQLFNNDLNGHPPSGAADPNGAAYCGAMKLCEALTGQDCLGFHSESIFMANGKDPNGVNLYDPAGDLTARIGPYLPPESADAAEIQEIWSGAGGTAAFLSTSRVLCDVYARRLDSGKKVGMPILYYKADTSKTSHDVKNPDNPDNIYNYKDNHALLALRVPSETGKQHPLYADPNLFYKITRNKTVKEKSVPHNTETFILISPGYDGLYGTEDDVMNFKR